MYFLISFHNNHHLKFFPSWDSSKLYFKTKGTKFTSETHIFAVSVYEPGGLTSISILNTLEEVIFAPTLIVMFEFSSHLHKASAEIGLKKGKKPAESLDPNKSLPSYKRSITFLFFFK